MGVGNVNLGDGGSKWVESEYWQLWLIASASVAPGSNVLGKVRLIKRGNGERKERSMVGATDLLTERVGVLVARAAG